MITGFVINTCNNFQTCLQYLNSNLRTFSPDSYYLFFFFFTFLLPFPSLALYASIQYICLGLFYLHDRGRIFFLSFHFPNDPEIVNQHLKVIGKMCCSDTSGFHLFESKSKYLQFGRPTLNY